MCRVAAAGPGQGRCGRGRRRGAYARPRVGLGPRAARRCGPARQDVGRRPGRHDGVHGRSGRRRRGSGSGRAGRLPRQCCGWRPASPVGRLRSGGPALSLKPEGAAAAFTDSGSAAVKVVLVDASEKHHSLSSALCKCWPGPWRVIQAQDKLVLTNTASHQLCLVAVVSHLQFQHSHSPTAPISQGSKQVFLSEKAFSGYKSINLTSFTEGR